MRIIALALLGLLLGPGVGRAQTVEYYLLDALGSVRVVTDSTGQIVRDAQGQEVGRHEFEPFGEELQPLTTRDRKLFTGQERDHESGLDYFGARYYRADIGRFTTVDPVYTWQENLVDPQRWNRYAYARNNPLKYVDPDGRNPLLIMGGAGTVVFGGWKVVTNIQSGRPWHENVGYEAAKGFLVGATLGLAAPALATADIGIGTGTVLDAAAVGKAREVLVAELVGGRVAGDAKVTLQNVGSTGVDVFGKAGEFIGVGGPAKAGDLADFGRKLQILAGTAEQAGVKAQYYLAKGTPDAVVKLAQKWLGKENVFFFEMKQ